MNTGVKDRIIHTASHLFYKNGYNATGINEIIDKAGIAKATLYNHFKSKDELCVSYLRHMNTVFLDKIKTYCTTKRKGKSQILALFDFLKDFFSEKDFNGCWCIKTVAELPKDNKLIRQEIQYQKEQFMQFISTLIENNVKVKSKKESESKVRQIYLLYEGAVGESHLHLEEWPIIEAKAICAKLI